MASLGIIGAGIMGERLFRAAQAGQDMQVTGVWDSDPTAIARLGAPAAASADALIADADCIYIATPPRAHLAYARAALAAGKAVFLEKPLAVDVADARAFVAEAAGARIAVNYPFAASPAAETLHDWVRNGAVGTPRGLSIEACFREWPRPWQRAAASWLGGREEGGFTREVISHWLFLARRLFGQLQLRTSAAEFPVDGGAERRVGARFSAGGLPGTIKGEVGNTPRDEDLRFTIRGVGALRLRDWSFLERARPDGSWATDPDALPPDQARAHTLARQLNAVAAMTRGQPHRLATLSEAFDVQEAVEAILAGLPTPRVTQRD